MTDQQERRSPVGEAESEAMKAGDAQAVGVTPDVATRTPPRDAAQPDRRPGGPVNRRSPYFVGLVGAAGVATTYALVQLLIAAREVLVLVGLALFLAIGLDPAVRWLARWLPRWAAVAIVTLGMVLTVFGFLAAAIPPPGIQSTALTHQLPHHLAPRLAPRATVRRP